jgi:hypothetical protein
MSADDAASTDEQFPEQLAAWDEALAAGGLPPSDTPGPDHDRLGRGLDCLRRLRHMRRWCG